MTQQLSERQVRLLRLRGQRLYLGGPGDVAAVLGEVVGLQAQDANAAALGVRVRSIGLLAADVEAARVEQRSILRSWFMRGTIHLVAMADAGWLLALLGPINERSGVRRRAQLGLDEETADRAVDLLCKELADGPQSKAGLEERLARRDIPTTGQGIIHIIGLAAARGLLCIGPWRGSKQTYVLMADWVKPGKKMERHVVLAELARRYLAAYGPARPEDLATWSGLPMGDARAGWRSIAAELIEVAMPDGPGWLLRSRAAWLKQQEPQQPLVNLAPAFETYLLGHRTRTLALTPEQARRILSGIIPPVVLVDGVVRGAWHIEHKRQRAAIVVEPFAKLEDEIMPGLEAEVQDVGRFLGKEISLMEYERRGGAS